MTTAHTDTTAAGSARDFLPERLSMKSAREAAAVCRGCALWKSATQTVFGEGPRRARLMLVGETPGDREDLAGRPFVGPAGRVLDESLTAAGIERDDAYVTNVVKHFKWEPRGKRRLHKKPSASEIAACRPWLDAEIELVRPQALVCLGATAARALLGPRFLVSKERGRPVKSELARTSRRRCIPRPCCACPTRARGTKVSRRSSPTSATSPGHCAAPEGQTFASPRSSIASTAAAVTGFTR